MKDARGVRIDFHVHTSYSFDSLTPPKTVVEVARRRGLNAIAVTDHDCVEGALAAIDANRDPDFTVIPGIEIKTDLGDVIALYVTRNVRSRVFADVLAEIHELGGAVCIPHPMRTFGLERSRGVHAAHDDIDLWERYNGRYDARHYGRADEFFEGLGLRAALSGSDAHFPWEIGLVYSTFERVPHDPQSLVTEAALERSSANARGEIAVRAGTVLGETIKRIKRKEYARAGRLLAGLPLRAAKRMLHGRTT